MKVFKGKFYACSTEKKINQILKNKQQNRLILEQAKTKNKKKVVHHHILYLE